MGVTVSQPVERFPMIGTVESPALFCDGQRLLVCYEIAVVDGGGTATIEFRDIVSFSCLPLNIDGLHTHNTELSYWDINEVSGDPRLASSSIRSRRLWVISFNDVTLEILFGGMVGLVDVQRISDSPEAALRKLISGKRLTERLFKPLGKSSKTYDKGS
jgi:hypothetical protein